MQYRNHRSNVRIGANMPTLFVVALVALVSYVVVQVGGAQVFHVAARMWYLIT